MFPLIQENISLADKNWFKVGGSARYYAEPTNEQEFQQALFFARDHKLPIFVLGQGANILISDAGFAGLVIRPQGKQTTITDGQEYALVTADSGVTIHDLIDYCLDNNLGGLEEFSGIPGTVGGSVYINLHYFEFLLEQFVITGRVIHKLTGEISDVPQKWFQFAYDDSTLMQHEYFLLSATFKVKKISTEQAMYARGRRHEIIRHRARRYPATNTCGSFFRNFHESEVTYESNGKKMTFVAYYLDKIGVKGSLRIGDAGVSWQHANMIVNGGKAKAQDIVDLARAMQELCWKAYGVLPQPECQLIGFDEYPLFTLTQPPVIPTTSKESRVS
jgi:UDP-N-acetylmuramate dehydrogenase